MSSLAKLVMPDLKAAQAERDRWVKKGARARTGRDAVVAAFWVALHSAVEAEAREDLRILEHRPKRRGKR